MLASGRTEELMERVFGKYQELRRGKDLVIVEGTTVSEAGLLCLLRSCCARCGRAARLQARCLPVSGECRGASTASHVRPSLCALLPL